jgi:hypothetical protein
VKETAGKIDWFVGLSYSPNPKPQTLKLNKHFVYHKSQNFMLSKIHKDNCNPRLTTVVKVIKCLEKKRPLLYSIFYSLFRSGRVYPVNTALLSHWRPAPLTPCPAHRCTLGAWPAPPPRPPPPCRSPCRWCGATGSNYSTFTPLSSPRHG